MIVVRVELWPGGDPARAEEIGRAGIANLTPGSVAAADYVAVLERPREGDVRAVLVAAHDRRDGIWALLARACGIRRPADPESAGRVRDRMWLPEGPDDDHLGALPDSDLAAIVRARAAAGRLPSWRLTHELLTRLEHRARR